MDEIPQSTEFFSFDLGEGGDLCSFQSVEELEAWIRKEREYWNWVGQVRINQTDQVRERQNAPLAEIENVIRQLRQAKSGSSFDHVAALEAVFERHYCDAKAFHSSSREAKFIELMRQENPSKALVALAHLMGIGGFTLTQPHVISAVVEAVLFSRKVSGVADSELAALEDIKETYKDAKDKIAHQLEPLVSEGKRLEKDLTQLHGTHDAALNGLREKQVGEFQQSIEATKKTLLTLEKAYDVELSLHKPVRYWHNKAKRHGALVVRYTVASLAVGMFSFALACGAIGYVPDYISRVVSANGAAPAYIYVAPLVVVAFLLFWLLRVLVRLLLSHIHLQTDATEKETMIQTYLALLRNPNAVTKEERKFILESVFHRSSTGIVKDDSSPPTLFDLIFRR